MKMTEIEIQKICEMANFLDDKGYTRKIEGDTILYSNNRIDIIVYIRENYSMMMDIDYCKESNRLVDEFIKNELRKKMP